MKQTGQKQERRRQRATDLARAMTYQLEACRMGASSEAMMVSDEDGLCLAASGERETCDELAAELPQIGRKTPEFAGVLLARGGGGRQVTVHRFNVGADELYVCAVGGDARRIPAQMARSISGLSRILTT